MRSSVWGAEAEPTGSHEPGGAQLERVGQSSRCLWRMRESLCLRVQCFRLRRGSVALCVRAGDSSKAHAQAVSAVTGKELGSSSHN